MTQKFGDWVNKADWDEDDLDDEYDDDDPLDPMRFDPWRGFLVVPGEYADDETPEDEPEYVDVHYPMDRIWRYCPACGEVDIAFPDGTFRINECEHCSMIPF